jgi:hypothetical protein
MGVVCGAGSLVPGVVKERKLSRPAITNADISRAHREMRIATPLDSVSPLQETVLTAVARWIVSREDRRAKHRSTLDIKRRAAGDFDD